MVGIDVRDYDIKNLVEPTHPLAKNLYAGYAFNSAAYQEVYDEVIKVIQLHC